MASPTQRPDDELPLAEDSSHKVAKKSHKHKKQKKPRHKGMDPAQSPGCSKKRHRQKRFEDDGAALSGGLESPFSHSGEEQFASLSSGGPAKSNHLSPSSPEGDKPLTKDLSPGDDTTARTGGAAEVKDVAALASPDSLISPTSASAAQKQCVELKDPRAADVKRIDGEKRTEKKQSKKKRRKGAQLQALSAAEAMLSPLSLTTQEEQEALSIPLSGEVATPIDSLSLNEKLKSCNELASSSGPLSPMVEEVKSKSFNESAAGSGPLSPTVEEEKLKSSNEVALPSGPLSPMMKGEQSKSSDEATSPSGPLSPTVGRKAGEETPIHTGESQIPRQPIPFISMSPSPQKSDIGAVKRRRHELLCGVMGFYPGFLQSYRTPRCALTVLCLVSFTRSFSMTGVMMVVSPTLERRFQLKAYESGMILSSNDVASCLTMLPVAFLATQRNKPRFIGYGVAILGLGNFIVATAHFLAPGYRLSAAGTDLCPMTGFSSSCTKTGSIRNYRFILMAGQLISGLGATPINTVTIAYLDENLPRRQSSLYIGIFNSMTIIGPAVGFIVGGYTLTYYVNISTDVSSMGLTSESPAWVGAWWLGSVVTAVMGLTLGVMTCSFPKYLPGYEAARAEKSDQTPVSVLSMIGTSNFGRRISDLPKAIRRLLTNVPFLFLCVSFSFSQMFTTGLTAMMTKFFESQLGLPSARIAYMIGPIVLVGGGFGAIIGGALVSRWNLNYEGIMRLCMCNCCFSWFGVLIFTFSCPQGIYATPDGFVGEVVTSSFSWQCNADCNCTTSLLNPICGADGVVYLSPCLAGCQRELQVEDLKMYSGCTCINGTVSQVPGLSTDQLLLEAVQATRSRCSTDCVLLFPFLAGIFLSLSACFLNAAPATAASIRCVKPAQRSLALGIRQVIGRLAGSIPAPVIFGGILDQTRLSWHQSCGKSGNCIVYENEGLSRGLFYALAVTLSFNMACYYASLVAHRRYTRQHAMVKKRSPQRSN